MLHVETALDRARNHLFWTLTTYVMISSKHRRDSKNDYQTTVYRRLDGFLLDPG